MFEAKRWVAFVIAVAMLSGSAPAMAQEIVKFPASQPNEPTPVQLRAELYRPTGGGPHPAVVLMHGCSGWVPSARFALRGYAEDLRKRGFVVLNLDSFGPRYYSSEEMCPSIERLQRALSYRTTDAFDAARFLRDRADVDAGNIFLFGQSNGGSVALKAALVSTHDEYVKRRGYPAFRGVVAFYPWCGLLQGITALAAPVQVFSGGRDNWVSAQECSSVEARGAEFNVKVYAEAMHSFDLDLIPHKYAGFMIGKDPAAAADSRTRMMSFLTANVRGSELSRR